MLDLAVVSEGEGCPSRNDLNACAAIFVDTGVRNPEDPFWSRPFILTLRQMLRLAALTLMAFGAWIFFLSVRELSELPLPVYAPAWTGMMYRYGTSGQLVGIGAGIFFFWIGLLRL